MKKTFYTTLTEKSLKGELPASQTCHEILTSPAVELLALLDAAYQVRKTYFGNEVAIHIINNAQNGHCPEDCHYCAQAKTSRADIEEYPLKPDEEIFAEAKEAYESGAYRYCMVFAGRGPSKRRVEHLARLVREITARYPIRICISTGLLDEESARILKEAGLDRLNHNLNTSREHYPKICTTHTYTDRLSTLQSARKAGIELCSGMIVGMGENAGDIIEVAMTLRELNVPSIPVNFFIPIEGNSVTEISVLSPQYCLRVLCLFRFLNPKAEIRIAAGREIHLRGLEVMGLYPANSLFLGGYLNAKGSSRAKTLRMIQDAGFSIKAEQSLEELLKGEGKEASQHVGGEDALYLKGLNELRPHMVSRTAQA